MTLKTAYALFFSAAITTLFTCKQEVKNSNLNGTWKLISSELITNGQSERTFPVQGQEMIKIFNDTHFAFFKHDINKGKDKNAVFDSGSGTYSLEGNVYKEHLAFCNYRDWENHNFTFNLTIRQDTIIQRGVEKIDSLNINHEIVETYVRIKK